jgi:putative peptidoglycan lipid II flippase
MQTLVIAILLHRRRMVSLASLDYAEMGRCLLAALAGGGAVAVLSWAIGSALGYFSSHLHGAHLLRQAHTADLAILIAGIMLWLAVVKVILDKTGSALPKVALKRLRLQ